MNMNIAVVDDISEERKDLICALNDYAVSSGISIDFREFGSAEELLDGYRPYLFTVIFMDIYMDGMTGIEAAEKIRSMDRRALFIFLTTSDAHMARALKLHAFDYLEKPATRERIFSVMDDLLEQHTQSISAEEPRLSFISGRNEVSLPYRDIVLICTSDRNYLDITDSKGNTYKTRLTFREAENRLSADDRFLTMNRGVIANMDYISGISKGICHIKDGEQIPINLKGSEEIGQIWTNYKFNQIRLDQRKMGGGIS